VGVSGEMGIPPSGVHHDSQYELRDVPAASKKTGP
jgi:hypothetical protein